MKTFKDKKRLLRFLTLLLLIPFYWAIYAGCMGGINSGGGGGSSPTPVSGISNPTEGGAGGGGGPGSGGGPGDGSSGGGDGTDVAGGPSGQTGDDAAVARKHEYVEVHVLPPTGYRQYALKKTDNLGGTPDTFADPTDIYPDAKPQAVLKMAASFEGPYSNFGDPYPTDSSGYLLLAYPIYEEKNVCKSFIMPYATFEWRGTTYIAEGCPLICPHGSEQNPYKVDIQLKSPGTTKKPCLPVADTSGMVNSQ